MLDAQTAQEQLKTFYVEDWTDRQVARARGLRGDRAAIACAILGRDPRGQPLRDWNAQREALAQALPRLEDLPVTDRQAVFEALFARLSPYVEQAWEMHSRLPYQVGADRKAFRAPGTPAVLRWARAYWLQQIVWSVRGYAQDITWFAAWAPYLHWGMTDALGILFAAAIDAGGREGDVVFDTLVASACGEHEIGAMGRHVTRGLLVASRAEGWSFVERLLLSAQRQEGLRQVILETIDEAHPAAFRRLLRLILEHDLSRFSATVRAADVWFGMGWQGGETRHVDQVLRQALHFLDDPHARAQALEGEDGEAIYLALWALAYQDASAAVAPATRLLQSPVVERRFAGVHLLSHLGLPAAQPPLLSALEDPDLRVAARALGALQRYPDERLREADLFERVERLLPRLPRQRKELPAAVWPWLKLPAAQSMATNVLLWSLGDRSPKRLVPYLPRMSPHERAVVVQHLADLPRRDAEVRETLLALVGDRSPSVREQALQALADHAVTVPEAVHLEGLLARKAGDLRRGVLSMLLNQPDQAVVDSAGRLLGASSLPQRLAGLDLLRQMVEAGRLADRCRACAARYRSEQSALADAETRLLDLLLDAAPQVPTLDDALGLADPAARTPPTPPCRRVRASFLARQEPLVTPAAIACVQSLDALVHCHRTTPVVVKTWDGGSTQETLLGNVRWGFSALGANAPIAEDGSCLPLWETWESWWAQRPGALRDDDGLELLRALAFCAAGYPALDPPPWLCRAQSILFAADDRASLQYPAIVYGILQCLLCAHPPEDGAADLVLDAVETTLALVPQAELASSPAMPYGTDWRHHHALIGWLTVARQHQALCPETWQGPHYVRLWGLLRWMDEPGPAVLRARPLLEDVLRAFYAGGATEADLLDHLLGPRPEPQWYAYASFGDLGQLSGRKPHPLVEAYPILHDLVHRCRERILEVELARGEMPTAASRPALSLRYAGGLETLLRLLRALGRTGFVRGWTYDSLGKAAVLSHLIRSTVPLATDTPAAFADRVRSARIPRKRLVELAVYAPQWASFVEHALQWPGFAGAVWWLYAHTKDARWSVDREIRDLWNAQVSEHTPLSGQQLVDGAVDVAWFLRVHDALGPERWAELYSAARLASGGGGHKRAQLFADAMLGHVGQVELVSRIEEKRHKDAVRALGLLPLARGEARESDLLQRYRVLQAFLRTSRRFGSQRQASEGLAAQIGIENLARTAGYPDPLRLEWAMEARETADLIAGAQVVVKETTITLAIDPLGEPELAIEKEGKRLRRIPAALKKDPRVADLCQRQRRLRQQASRMRRSLEEAMSRGDAFTGAELAELCAHPLLAPMLGQLVFVGSGVAGYPVEGGTALQCHDGQRVALDAHATLRIAHPHDLYRTQEWHLWQRECYAAGRTQPFKQVFRELYLLTEGEQAEKTLSRRYAGHQVNPRQALALLGRRGWVNYPEEGVLRTFHDEGISARLAFLQGFFTPAEVEGLTLDSVSFARRGEWKALPLEQVPPRLFSEVMRDLDLVVSVAHQGGVDPEASASTVEMRAALIREACALLGIANVELQGRYALIEGTLASYNVHLGSAVVHQQPGGAICIVPVHAQHRGRLFLPFADDDPRTAEVLSKVLLLARDREIQDPTILQQILNRP